METKMNFKERPQSSKFEEVVMRDYLFTSESVTEGHPDKLCDFIADSVLDAFLEKDKNSRVACEVMSGKGEILVTGEITSTAKVDIEGVIRNAIKEVGYNDANTGIDYKTCDIEINISQQSPDIALGTNDEVGGAGDQGIIFGFACDETKECMPLPISLAHGLAKRLAEVRKSGELKYLRPDGKTQVTVEYEDDKPKRVEAIVVSTQHTEEIEQEQLRRDVMQNVIKHVIPANLLDNETKYFINPTGRFIIGGPLGDSGLTGRKLMVDTYGGYARHGGGAFSGKDPTKVDRSAAYMARFIAKNIVANKLARKFEIQISYAIGIAKPVSLYINTFGTNQIPEEEIIQLIEEKFDLTPQGIIECLDLRRPIYKKTTNYGHFGREEFSWERVIEITKE